MDTLDDANAALQCARVVLYRFRAVREKLKLHHDGTYSQELQLRLDAVDAELSDAASTLLECFRLEQGLTKP